jgi:hypothetical protein
MLQNHAINALWPFVIFNWGFVFFQLLIVSAWFSFRQKKWVNVTAELLGWGDILMIISIGVYLSILNFLIFYIGSLVLIILIWSLWVYIFDRNAKYIPLAGMQAGLLTFCFIGCWWLLPVNATSDDFLLKFLSK